MTLHRQSNAEPRHTFEWSRPNGPSQAVVEAVAAAKDTGPLDVDQLYGVIDPDALDSLFARSDGEPGIQSVQFQYHGFLVVVESVGTAGRGYVFDADSTELPRT